jgi:alpha-beta hydrolase superfamily lysophospholipase
VSDPARVRPGRPKPAAVALTLAGMLLALASAALGLATWNSSRAAGRMIAHRGPAPAPGDPVPADSGLAFTDVPLAARDGTQLAGWWIVPADGARRPDLAVVVMAHAANDRGKASLLELAPALHRAGYILLLFDFRSYGGSAGTRTTYGFLEQQDLEAAIRLARERALGAPIALLGQGMGATTALLVAAQDPGVVCVVADSPWHSWDEAFFSRPGVAESGVGRLAPEPLVRWALRREVGFGFGTTDARQPLTAAPLAASRPVMAIYGEKDRVIPFHLQIKIVSALGTPNATWAWRAPGAEHLGAYASAPDEYRARVIEFLDASMTEWARRRNDP